MASTIFVFAVIPARPCPDGGNHRYPGPPDPTMSDISSPRVLPHIESLPGLMADGLTR